MPNGSTHLSTWGTQDTKQRFSALARELGLSESALLKRSVSLMLQGTSVDTRDIGAAPERVPRDLRLYVRLRPLDHRLLRERAAARGMAAATYASLLVRAHVNAVTPLPDRELDELKRAVAAVGVMGRNLNQIARAANQGGAVTGPSVGDLLAVMRALEALRDHFKNLLQANAASWETGNAETHG